MATTRIGAAIDTLVDLWQTALPDITVYDGSLATMSFDGDWLVVGGDGPPGEEEDAASGEQRWNGLGAKTRDETVTVTCAAGASYGGTIFKTVRDSALTTLAAAEQALRDDPGLGNTTQGGAEMTEAKLRYFGNGQGVGAALVFEVSIPYRLERS
jgi:hypothetical protein